MISPWDLYRQAFTLFTANWKYLLKFWLASMGLVIGGLLILTVMLIFTFRMPVVSVSVFFLSFPILVFWIASASLVLYKSLMENQVLPVKGLFFAGWKIIWPVFFTGILSGLAVVGGFILLIIPGLIFTVWFHFAGIIVIMENVSGSQALSRSKALVSGRFWTTVKYLIVPILVSIIVSVISSSLTRSLTSAGVAPTSRFFITFPVTILTLVVNSVTALYSFLVYRQFAASVK